MLFVQKYKDVFDPKSFVRHLCIIQPMFSFGISPNIPPFYQNHLLGWFWDLNHVYLTLGGETEGFANGNRFLTKFVPLLNIAQV